MTPTDTPKARTCVACGESKTLSRFGNRGRGRSTVCRACWADGARPPKAPTAPVVTVEGGNLAGEPLTTAEPPEPVAAPVPGSQRQQVLGFAKELRRVAHETRAKAKAIVSVVILALAETEGNEGIRLGVEGFEAWLDEVPAKRLDQAATQLELLCK
jgi:hypothetical protein